MFGIFTDIRRIEPESFWIWTRALLVAGFGLFAVLILFSAAQSVMALLAICGVISGAILFTFLARNEVALLCAILAGFVVVVRYEEGFQVEEAIYGLLYLGYLAYWFISRLFFYRDDVLRTRIDWALFLFLIYVTLSLVLTPLQDGRMSWAVSEWLSISMLAFYFPIKEVCIRRRDHVPQKAVLMSLGFVALFVAIRNLNDYRVGLSQAEYLWQIASGRVVMNEHILLMAGIASLLFLLYARTWTNRVVLGVLFFLFSSGVIIGQSRAVWVSLALGIAVVFFFVEKRKRIQLLVLGALSLAAVLIVGALVFDDFFSVLVAGFTGRLLSLQTALTQDISLINRFHEIKAAWTYVEKNPIVGHGFGVPFKYYSMVYEATRVSSYVHNGYVGVMYRHGFVGFFLVMFFYFGTIWCCFRLAMRRSGSRFHRLMAITAVACLTAEALLANSANPFATSDTSLIIGAAAALGAASRHHAEEVSREPRED